MIQAGISRNFFGIGNTNLYGEYGRVEGGALGIALDTIAGGAANLRNSKTNIWGLGVVQNIDAAAMEIYAGYRNFDASLTGAPALNDICVFTFGSRIKF